VIRKFESGRKLASTFPKMKKLIFLIVAFSIFQNASAQVSENTLRPLIYDQKSPDFLQYRPRWNIRIAAGLATTWRYKNNLFDAPALALSVEPSYRLNNYIAVGVRGEYAFTKSYLAGQGRVNADPIGSVAVTGDIIKLWGHKYAPFIGIAAGAYFLGNGRYSVGGNSSNQDARVVTQNLGTRFGVSPRIGVNINSFSIGLEMHLIDEKTLANRDYATLKVGYTL